MQWNRQQAKQKYGKFVQKFPFRLKFSLAVPNIISATE
jgi:hypothetical protein